MCACVYDYALHVDSLSSSVFFCCSFLREILCSFCLSTSFCAFASPVLVAYLWPIIIIRMPWTLAELFWFVHWKRLGAKCQVPSLYADSVEYWMEKIQSKYLWYSISWQPFTHSKHKSRVLRLLFCIFFLLLLLLSYEIIIMRFYMLPARLMPNHYDKND